MNQCDFDKLVHYLDKQLDIDQQLELFDHLDRCEVCREAIFLLSRDRDAAYFVLRPCKTDADALAS